MIPKKNFWARIRGWFPQEPISPHKKLQLETSPIKLKQANRKTAINSAQFISVLLAFFLILGGLSLNALSNTESTYHLAYEEYINEAPVEFNGTNYNCTIIYRVEPPLSNNKFGLPRLEPIYIYLNEPSNITSGSYIATLKYAHYNAASNIYTPEETNESGTFSPAPAKNQDLVYSATALSAPFEAAPNDQQSIIRSFVFTIYCNSTGKLTTPLCSIVTPINLTQGDYRVIHPYSSIGNVLLSIGIISLVVVLLLSFVNLSKKPTSRQGEAQATGKGTQELNE